MEPAQVRRAIAAARALVDSFGLPSDDAIVVHNSDRIVVRLPPGNLLARIAPRADEAGFRFEVAVAHQLAAAGSPVGALAPRIAPRAFVRDGFVLTFWTYYEPAGRISPAAYADALGRLHADLRRLDLAAPHIGERVAGWLGEIEEPAHTPDLPDADRALLGATLRRARTLIDGGTAGDQLLHGEPHPGNLLRTGGGPRFIDFHTCQRGPVEYDLAFLPEEAAAHYPRADQHLVHQYRILRRAGFTTMRWRPSDQFPDRDHWRVGGLTLLRALLDRH